MKREITVKCPRRELQRVFLKKHTRGSGFDVVVNATQVGDVFRTDRPSKATAPWAAGHFFGGKRLTWHKTALAATRAVLCAL